MEFDTYLFLVYVYWTIQIVDIYLFIYIFF